MSNGPVTTTIDQQLALDTICATVQTYKAFLTYGAFPGNNPLDFITPPDGWTYVDFFSGLDVFSKSPIQQLQLFGLVFQSQSDTGTYLFAIRGTEGFSEWVDDFHISKDPFQPQNPGSGPTVPSDALAELGFSEIYYSMQSALFALVAKYQPTQLVITGHSLGSALAELFTLDVAISLPGQSFTSLNHAAPRAGNAAFAAFYETLTSAVGNTTVRVANTKDVIPCVPPDTFFGFTQVGVEFAICFEEASGLPNLLLRHNENNYYRSLCNTFGTSNCDCALRQPEDDLQYCTADGARDCSVLLAALNMGG